MTGPKNDRPNLLVVMSDEHGPMFSGAYGHALVDTPNMDRLAREGVTFDAAYCNSPLCVPSRLSFLTGRYPNRVGAWDNATVLKPDALTWPFMLRALGYEVVLGGKMHLLDNLHGFQEQLVAGDRSGTGMFTPWSESVPVGDVAPWSGVPSAGPGTSPIIKHDEAAEAAALRYLNESAAKHQPFALCVGFLAPHFPYVVPEPYFSRYYPDRVDLPNLPPGHLENLPAGARRRRRIAGWTGEPYSDDEVLRARAAYFGLCTYMDEKVGRLIDALATMDLADNTIIVHTSDHGEMLGEHGLWRKNCFYEQSARVPLQMVWPGVLPAGKRVGEVVSLVDVTATILDVAGAKLSDRPIRTLDGASLMPIMCRDGAPWANEAFSEYEAPATDRPEAMLRVGDWKLCYGHGDPPELELYHLETDPGEFDNLAASPRHAEVRDRLLARLLELWDPEWVEAEVIASQEARLIIGPVLGRGERTGGELAGVSFDPNHS